MNLKLEGWIYHTSRFGRDCPGLNVCPGVPSQNVPEFHFSEIFKNNSSLMMHCYEIIPS